jgi:hypothetical protein
MCYQNYLAMCNTAEVTGGKPLAVCSPSDQDSRLLRHPWKKERGAYFVPDTTRDLN